MEGVPERLATRRGQWLVVLLLIVAAVAPFAQTLGFGYVFDDTFAIRSNPDLRGWGSLVEVWKHTYGGVESPFYGLYRPLTMTIFAAVWNAGGGWPLWFHLLAVVMHALVTLLVWRLLERTLGRGPATLAALWFAVHPVHVEAVANIANSSEVLVAIFTCGLTLYFLELSEGEREIPWSRAAIAGALYLAAFLSKESGVMSPILAALVVWGWRGTTRASNADTATPSLRRWLPVLVACCVAGVIVLILRALVLGGPVTGEPIAAAGLDRMNPSERVWAMLSLGPTILRLLAWPVTVNPHYGPATFPRTGADWLAAATVSVLIASVVTAAWLARRGDRRALVPLGWITLAFLPASNLLVPTGQILAERTLYVPSIGVAMLIGLALAGPRDRAGAPRAWRVARTAMFGIVALVTAVFAGRSSRWSGVWRNHAALFDQMIAADTSSYVGYWFSGAYEGRNSHMDRALVLLERAFAKYPYDPGLTLDYSDALLQQGHAARAASIAAPLLQRPGFRSREKAVQVYLDALGRAFGAESVIAAGRRLMDQTPSASAALFLGRALEVRGDSAAAATVYRDGVRAFPGDRALRAKAAVLGPSR